MDNIENLEKKLVRLQNEIEILQKSMHLTDVDQKGTLLDEKATVRNNSLEVKHLEKEVGELQIRLQKQQLSEVKVIEEAIYSKCKQIPDLKASSATELLEKLESRVLELNVKAQAQLHDLKHLERTFNEENELLKKMTETCRQDDISTEADCLQKIRNLEKAHSTALRNIGDCENVNEKMKKMLKNMQKKKMSYVNLLSELKKEQRMLTQKEDKHERTGKKDEVRESKEKELEKLKSEISLVKDVTCCHDIRDIDSALLEQKAMSKDLEEIAKKAEKRLFELKEDKRNLVSKRALMKEVDSVYPKSSDENLFLAKNRLQEQQRRLDTAKEEMERINIHTNRTKEVFQNLILKMNPKVNKVEISKKNLKQLSKQLENVVKYTFPPTEAKISGRNQK